MSEYLLRSADRVLSGILGEHAATFVVGPRATGKTTTCERFVRPDTTTTRLDTREYIERALRSGFPEPALRLGGAAHINRQTARGDDRLLQHLLVADRVPSWTSSRLKRLVLASKRYLIDPGLLADLQPLGVTLSPTTLAIRRRRCRSCSPARPGSAGG